MAFRKNKRTDHPLWRPDFRDSQTLPDIKVIRTDFLLNAVSVSLAIGLLGLLLYREYRSVQLSRSIDDVVVNIESNEKANEENLRMSAEFSAIQKPMEEVARFKNVPITPDGLLTEVARMQPDAVILESVKFSGDNAGKGKDKKATYTLVLSGTIKHTLEHPAPQAISEYRTALERLPGLAPYFMESELSGFTRNDALGVFNFTIRLKLSENAREGGKTERSSLTMARSPHLKRLLAKLRGYPVAVAAVVASLIFAVIIFVRSASLVSVEAETGDA